MGWRWTASITAMSCCLSRCFQQSNVLQNVVYSQNNILLTAKLVIFLSSEISQGKVVALDRWGGKWNNLSMRHSLATNYAKNYCNRTPIIKVIVENVVTCFLGHSVQTESHSVTGCRPISCTQPNHKPSWTAKFVSRGIPFADITATDLKSD